jgi:adenylate cyclase
VENPRSLVREEPIRRARRRFAAVLVLDVVGYSRQVAVDPDGTLAAMRVAYRRIVRPAVAAERGRVVKLTGDGALAEFALAGQGARAAVAIQRAFAAPREHALRRRPLALRAGLHLGEVLDQDGDIFGATVNIAARLEAAAAPGGILMSRAVCDRLTEPLAARLLDLGFIRLAELDRAIHVVAAEITAA